jgi:hypothetical protein
MINFIRKFSFLLLFVCLPVMGEFVIEDKTVSVEEILSAEEIISDGVRRQNLLGKELLDLRDTLVHQWVM